MYAYVVFLNIAKNAPNVDWPGPKKNLRSAYNEGTLRQFIFLPIYIYWVTRIQLNGALVEKSTLKTLSFL